MPQTKLDDSDGNTLGSCNEDDVQVQRITVGKYLENTLALKRPSQYVIVRERERE
jgi:hypothetical protein